MVAPDSAFLIRSTLVLAGKMQELIKEYENRKDVSAQELFCLKGFQDYSIAWDAETKWDLRYMFLSQFPKAFKTYQDYLGSLHADFRQEIKECWHELHKKVPD